MHPDPAEQLDKTKVCCCSGSEVEPGVKIYIVVNKDGVDDKRPFTINLHVWLQ